MTIIASDIFSPPRRLEALPVYPVADLAVKKRQLLAEGVDVIDLGAGDADLEPPPAAVRALQGAADDPRNSRYSFQLGLVEFREEIARWMDRRFGVDVDPFTEVLPLIGSKEGIFHLPLAVTDPGAAMLIPDPGYAPYLGGTILAGGEPVILPLQAGNGFLADLDAVPLEVRERAKILYLNYPNNPTSAIAPREYLRDVVRFCDEYRILLAYDNAYSELGFDGYRPPSILEIDGAREVAVEFHSLSKTYNMTGWRVGWASGNPKVLAALSRVKSFADTGVPFTIQHAAAATLRAYDDWFPANLETFRRRRDAAVAGLQEAGVEIEVPQASMCLWFPVPPGCGTSGDFARRLLDEQGVTVLPGDAMGRSGEGYLRMSLTTSEVRLREATRRMTTVIRG